MIYVFVAKIKYLPLKYKKVHDYKVVLKIMVIKMWRKYTANRILNFTKTV